VAAAKRDREEQPGALLHSSHPQSSQTTWFSSLRPRAAVGGKPAESSAASQTDPSLAEAPALDADGGRPEPAVQPIVAAAPALAPRPLVMPVFQDTFEGLRLLLTLAALVAVGYFGWQRLEPHTRLSAQRTTPAVVVPLASPAVDAPRTDPKPAPTLPNAVPLAHTETVVHSGTDPSMSLGRILPYVDPSHGVAVGPEQGLLVLEYAGAAPLPRIQIDTREIGPPPIAIPLDAGRHELVVHRNRDSSFRYLIVRAGETRIVTLPL
jgi:hypothetical protein